MLYMKSLFRHITSLADGIHQVSLQAHHVACWRYTWSLSSGTSCRLLTVYIKSLFRHITSLADGIPAHDILKFQVDLESGRPPSHKWKHHPGRPCNRWTDQLRMDSGIILADLWRSAVQRVMEEWHYGPHWLCTDDDNNDSAKIFMSYKSATY